MNLLWNDEESKERIFRLPIKLTPCQKKIDASTARYKIIRAGRKFGKTTYAMYQALKWLAPPHSRIWFLAATYRQAKLITWAEFKRLIPHEAMKRKPNDTDLTITLKNGSELSLLGTDDMDMLRGPAPDGVIFEEAALHKPEVWHEVIRPNLIPKKSPAVFISTPKGFNWLKDLEDSARLSKLQGGDEWEVFHYTIYDNPLLDPKELEQAKRDCDNEQVWRQEYLAEYESSVGRVFASFSQDRHMGPVPSPQGVPAYRAIDWGMRDDTAALWAYIQDNKLMVYREHAENNLPSSAQAQMIRNKTGSDERIERNIIGHDAAKQDTEMRGLTVRWHFSNAGITPLKVGSKDKKSSRAMLQQLISQDRIKIDNSCVKLRKQLLEYEWKDTVMEKTVDGNDDLVDALHSMVELLQYDLFLDRGEKEETLAEKYRRAMSEKRAPHRFPLSQESDVSSYDFNSPAGYL